MVVHWSTLFVGAGVVQVSTESFEFFVGHGQEVPLDAVYGVFAVYVGFGGGFGGVDVVCIWSDKPGFVEVYYADFGYGGVEVSTGVFGDGVDCGKFFSGLHIFINYKEFGVGGVFDIGKVVEDGLGQRAPVWQAEPRVVEDEANSMSVFGSLVSLDDFVDSVFFVGDNEVGIVSLVDFVFNGEPDAAFWVDSGDDVDCLDVVVFDSDAVVDFVGVHSFLVVGGFVKWSACQGQLWATWPILIYSWSWICQPSHLGHYVLSLFRLVLGLVD